MKNHKENTPTVQQQLFSLLNDQQKVFMAINLRPLKYEVQVDLCERLIDFIVDGEVNEPRNALVNLLYCLLIGHDTYEGYEPILYHLPGTIDPRSGIKPNEAFDLSSSR